MGLQALSPENLIRDDGDKPGAPTTSLERNELENTVNWPIFTSRNGENKQDKASPRRLNRYLPDKCRCRDIPWIDKPPRTPQRLGPLYLL